MVHAQGDNSYESTKVSNDHEINKRSDNLNEGGMPQCASIMNKVKREFIGISNRSQQIIHQNATIRGYALVSNNNQS